MNNLVQSGLVIWLVRLTPNTKNCVVSHTSTPLIKCHGSLCECQHEISAFAILGQLDEKKKRMKYLIIHIIQFLTFHWPNKFYFFLLHLLHSLLHYVFNRQYQMEVNLVINSATKFSGSQAITGQVQRTNSPMNL